MDYFSITCSLQWSLYYSMGKIKLKTSLVIERSHVNCKLNRY